VEFGTTGITSPGAGDYLKSIPVDEAFAKANREVVYSNSSAKGFVLLTLRRDEALAQLMTVSTITARAFDTAPIKTFRFTPLADGGVSPLTEV
jgi:alkaline phosphatase D